MVAFLPVILLSTMTPSGALEPGAPKNVVRVQLSSDTVTAGATEQIRTPIPAQQHGAEIYARMCAVCHGPIGEGYKADRAPMLANPNFLASVSDEFLRRAIAGGRAGTTMSAWAMERQGPLAPEDINAVIAFVRTWDHRPRAALDERPVTGSALRGGSAYTTHCAHCHGTNVAHADFVGIANPELLQDASNGFLREAIRNGRPNTVMLPYSQTLGDAGIEDVLAWLRTLQSTSAAHMPLPPARLPPIPLGPVPLNAKGPEPSGFHLYPMVTIADVVKTQLDLNAKMGILDARTPSDYANEHIAGAVSVPFYDPSPYLSALPKDAWLVCYCACPHAESGQLAQKLLTAGFTKVTVLDEGLGYWKTKNYPTRKGQAP